MFSVYDSYFIQEKKFADKIMQQPTDCLSAFGHFVELALKRLNELIPTPKQQLSQWYFPWSEIMINSYN